MIRVPAGAEKSIRNAADDKEINNPDNRQEGIEKDLFVEPDFEEHFSRDKAFKEEIREKLEIHQNKNRHGIHVIWQDSGIIKAGDSI